MLRTALIWLTIVMLVIGGVTLPAASVAAPSDTVAGMCGGDQQHAVPPTVRMQTATAQWMPVSGPTHDTQAVTVDIPSWHALRVLADAPASRPVPIVPSDPEAPGTGAVLG